MIITQLNESTIPHWTDRNRNYTLNTEPIRHKVPQFYCAIEWDSPSGFYPPVENFLSCMCQKLRKFHNSRQRYYENLYSPEKNW